jgi:hypothetical protein
VGCFQDYLVESAEAGSARPLIVFERTGNLSRFGNRADSRIDLVVT